MANRSQETLTSNESLLIEIQILKDKNEILQLLNSNITTKHKELTLQYQDAETKHNIGQEELHQILTSKYESRINKLSNKLAILQSIHNNLELQNQSFLQTVNDLQKKNQLLHNKINKQEHELKMLQQQNNNTTIDLQSQISEYQRFSNTQSIIIDDLKQKLEIAMIMNRRRRSPSYVTNKIIRMQLQNQKTSPKNMNSTSITPKLSLETTNELSMDELLCFVDNGGASQVNITPTPTPNLMKRPNLLSIGSICEDTHVQFNNHINYGSEQLSADLYCDLQKSETELTEFSMDIEHEQQMVHIQVAAN